MADTEDLHIKQLEEAVASYVEADIALKQHSQHTNKEAEEEISATTESGCNNLLQRQQAVQSLVNTLPSKVSFATLLCRMKDYLTHQDVRTRQSAMELLNDLIWYQGSSGDILQEQEVPAFIEFVCSRLGDFPSVRMCLDVIKALLRHHALKLPPPAPVTIFKAILKELHVPSMEQSLRQRAFEVLDLLVASNTFISQLHDSSVDFTALFVESMEGEKDPRCLLICLRIVKLVLRNWGDSLQELAESVFDVTGCYFPVTFTPPPNDPHGIKKEHLVHALEDALTSHHCLATFVFPLALEKLSSTIPAAKMDALRLIRLGVQRYGLKTCDRFMRDICDAIRNEVTHCSDEQVINVALSTVSSITNEISADAEQAVLSTTDQRKLDYCTLPPATESGPTKSWDNFVLPCVKSSLEEIERAPDSLVGRSSGKLLLACAQGNGYALARVLRTSFPTVSGLYSSPTGSKPSIRAAALRLIVGFVACIDRGIDYRENEHPFQPWVDTVLNTVCSVLIHGNAKNQNEQGTLHAGGTMRESRSLALRGLRDLLLRPPSPLVSLDEHYKLTEHLCNILLNDVDPVIREKCVEALACLASEKGHIRDAISSVVLPRLAKAVNYPFLENIEPSRVDENVSIAVRALRAIPRLCVGSQLAFPVINQLTVLAMQGRQEVAILRPTNIDDSYINDVYEEELDSSSAEYGVVDLPLNLRYSGFILFTVGELLRRNQTDPEVIKTAVSGNSTSLIVRPDGSDEIPAESLLNTLLRLLAGLVSREQLPVKVCHNFISRTVTQLFRTIISNMDQTNLGLIYSDVVELLVPSDAQNNFSLLSLDIGAKIMNVVKDINVESCSLLQMLLVLLTYAPKECKTEIPRVSSLLQQLASIFMEVPTLLTQEQESQSKARIEAISDTIGRTLAAVLNRHVGILKTTQGSDCMRDSIDQLIEHFDPATTPRPMQAIKGLIWITKGLSMISHRCSKELLTRICQCITSSEFGENVRSIAAQGLGAVIRDEEPLSKGSGCYVNPLYRQRCSNHMAKQFGLGQNESQRLPDSILHNKDGKLSPVLLGMCCVMADAPGTLLMEWSSNGNLVPLVIFALQNALKVKEDKEHGPQSHTAESITLAALRVLSAVIQKADSKLVAVHLQSIIPPLLRLSDHSIESNPIVRGRCIETLIHMTNLPYQTLFPYKKQVSKSLVAALEDPKRVVRRRAVTCRNEWLTLSANS